MKFKSTLENYLFVMPAVVIFAVFYIIPFISVFQLSFFDWDGILPTKIFVGLSNFKEIIADKIWWQSVWQSGYITLIALTFRTLSRFY